MGRSQFTHRFGLGLIGLALLAAGCTTREQNTPPLTGPSEASTAITIGVSPDVLNQDGASQSLVTITARDSNGQPLRNLPLRAEIRVDGFTTDFGRLSAKNVVTDANGRATVVYTAPNAVPGLVAEVPIQIAVTPAESDNANANTRVVTIRLVPPGVVGAPPSPLKPDFTPPSPTVGNVAFFQATVVDASNADATSQVASFVWDFGDGDSANGRNQTHVYDSPGTFAVTLTIIDTLGRVQRVTKSVTVGQGVLPIASFFVSPSSPIVGQSVNFNASGSTAEPGHRIADYAWNFGDGSTGSGQLVTHAYSQTGTYTISLKVTDDSGRESTLTQQSVTVGNGNPTADFTFNPSAPRSGQQVTFDASPSQAAPGRTIVSYSWSFGDGGSGTGQTVVHTFTTGATPTTYNVLLTVTDSAGRTSSITKPITVNP
jgi:PKD repeat protein